MTETDGRRGGLSAPPGRHERAALPLTRAAWLVACGLGLAASFACASAPPAPVATKPVGPTFEQKMSAILRLEDRRMLREAAPPPAPPPPPAAPVRGRQPAAAPALPPAPADLVRMLSDE